MVLKPIKGKKKEQWIYKTACQKHLDYEEMLKGGKKKWLLCELILEEVKIFCYFELHFMGYDCAWWLFVLNCSKFNNFKIKEIDWVEA